MTETLLDITFHSLSQESIIGFIAATVALVLISILWQNRKAMEVRFLILVELLAAIWAVMYGMEFFYDEPDTKKFWAQLSYFGISFLPLAFFLFATSFSHKKKLINPLNITLLSVIPFLTLVLVLTSDRHGIIWKEVNVLTEKNLITFKYGVGFWVFWAYSLLMIASGLFNLIHSFVAHTRYYKSQISIILVATLIPLSGNILYVTKLNPIPGLDWTPVFFIFTGLILTFGIVRFHMFDLVPYARNKLIDIMSDGVIIVNENGFIEDYNPAVARIFRWNHDREIYKHYSEVFGQTENLTKALSRQDSGMTEIALNSHEEQRYYQVRLTPLFSRTGKFSGHLIQINEITSQKEAEHQLKAEIKEKGRIIEDLDAFTNTVSHDLRNLLGSIFSSGEIIEKNITEENPELLKEFAGMIKTSAQKAINITRELLMMAKLDNQQLTREPLDMAAVFEEARFQLKEVIRKNRAGLSIPDSWPAVCGNAAWVELVWVNYLSNAIKYGGSPPEITIGFTPTDHGTIQFWVRDNGDGILPADQHRLFQRYVRLAPQNSEGHGLGLSIVKRMIEKQGGNIGLESTGQKGKGAKFWFELPVPPGQFPENQPQ